ncbi:MAG: hypothetical protein MUC86_11265 [Burkholderiaceae bacterium]|nr:hypothetical protein [Burkholderiaceae bacterium]
MPKGLAQHLAEAFEATAAKPERYRADTLARLLHLKTPGRPRVRCNPLAVGAYFAGLLQKGAGKTAAASECAARFDISERTAVRAWRA